MRAPVDATISCLKNTAAPPNRMANRARHVLNRPKCDIRSGCSLRPVGTTIGCRVKISIRRGDETLTGVEKADRLQVVTCVDSGGTQAPTVAGVGCAVGIGCWPTIVVSTDQPALCPGNKIDPQEPICFRVRLPGVIEHVILIVLQGGPHAEASLCCGKFRLPITAYKHIGSGQAKIPSKNRSQNTREVLITNNTHQIFLHLNYYACNLICYWRLAF